MPPPHPRDHVLVGEVIRNADVLANVDDLQIAILLLVMNYHCDCVQCDKFAKLRVASPPPRSYAKAAAKTIEILVFESHMQNSFISNDIFVGTNLCEMKISQENSTTQQHFLSNIEI